MASDPSSSTSYVDKLSTEFDSVHEKTDAEPAFDFVEEPSRDYFCPVTLEFQREPHQTLCCGNHISPEAATTLQKDGKPCPVCKEADLKTVPDKFFKRMVNEVKVHCPHKNAGCEWVGGLGAMERHLNAGSVEGECELEKIACTHSCCQTVQRRELATHMESECPRRPFKCQYCGHDATHSEITSQHYAQCEKFPLECPNKCGEEAIERHNLPTHREKCSLEEIACEFSHAGCTAKLQRAKMADHKHQSVEEHLAMAGKTVEQQAIVLQQHTKTIASLQRQAETTATWVKQLVAHLKPELLAESPSIIFIPPPAFIMTNFSQRKRAGDAWYSPPFYSHIGGYKMCLRVDANGNSSGTGTHVSLFVYLMQGEYDDDLLWPFRGCITFQMYNHRVDTGHLNYSVTFDDRLVSDTAGRVTKSKRAPNGWGPHKFTPHTALCYDASKNTEFLVNDCLNFRVTACKLTNLVM